MTDAVLQHSGGLSPDDYRLSMRISPRSKDEDRNAEVPRGLLVHRLTDTYKAVLRISRRSAMSVLCEKCVRWSPIHGSSEGFPREWCCPRCGRLFAVEFAAMEEIHDRDSCDVRATRRDQEVSVGSRAADRLSGRHSGGALRVGADRSTAVGVTTTMRPAARQEPSPLALFIWYSIPGSAEEPLEVTREQMKVWLEDADIDPVIMTVDVYPVNVFRSATTDFVDEYDHGSTRVKLFVREVSRSETQVMRHVIRQWVDGEGRTQENWVADLRFVRPKRMAAGRQHGTERLRTLVDQRLTDVDKARVTAFVDRCVARYNINLQRMPPHSMRAMIRNFLTGLGGVAVADSGGGAYLLAPLHRESLVALREIVRRSGPGCRLRVMPLPHDEPDLREMLLESIDADVASRALGLKAQIADWVDRNPSSIPTVARWSSWRATCGLLADHLVDHSERYDAAFDLAAAALEELTAIVDDWGRRVATRGRR